MSFTIPVSSGAQRPVPTEGMQPGRLIQIIDLGSQTRKVEGKDQTKRMVQLAFELAETASFKEGEPAEPFVVRTKVGMSLHAKSTLRPIVEALNGKFKSDEEAARFDVSTLLGKVALVGVDVVTGTDGKQRAYAGKIVALPKGMTMPPQYNESICYHTSEGEGGAFSKLLPFTQADIKNSPEWQAVVAEQH